RRAVARRQRPVVTRLADLVAHGLEGLQISRDRRRIAVGQLAVNRDRHRRPDQGPVGPLAVAQCRDDLRLAPCADAGLLVGRDVRADDMAEPGLVELEAAAELSSNDRPAGGAARAAALAP